MEEEVVFEDATENEDDDEDGNDTDNVTKDDNLEVEKNSIWSEGYFYGSEVVLGILYALPKNVNLGPQIQIMEEGEGERMLPRLCSRQVSLLYVSMSSYEMIDNIGDLLIGTDKSGNTAAHHAAYIGLTLTAKALFTAGASRWRGNITHDTPQSLLDDIPLGSGLARNSLYIAITSRRLLPYPLGCIIARTADFSYEPPVEYTHFLIAIQTTQTSLKNETEADYYSQKAINEKRPHAYLYRALFMLVFGFGQQQVQYSTYTYIYLYIYIHFFYLYFVIYSIHNLHTNELFHYKLTSHYLPVFGVSNCI